MKIEIELGFSHIRDSILAIDEKLAAMDVNDQRRISLQHLRNALVSGMPTETRKLGSWNLISPKD